MSDVRKLTTPEQRIAQLERRVAELEARLGRIGSVAADAAGHVERAGDTISGALEVQTSPLRIGTVAGSDLVLTDGTGDLQVGADGNLNMALDRNEVQVRDGAGGAGTLYLQHRGGDLFLVGGSMIVRSDGTVEWGSTTLGPATGSYDHELRLASPSALAWLSVVRTGSHDAVVMDANDSIQIGKNGSGNTPGIYSQPIYAATLSGSANMYVHDNGRLYRIASSARYKTEIDTFTADENALLSLDLVSFFDRHMVQEYEEHAAAERARSTPAADRLTPPPPEPTRFVGLLAEDVHAAGLTWAVQYDDQGRPDAIAYDRLAVALIPVVRRLRDQVAELQEGTSGT